MRGRFRVRRSRRGKIASKDLFEIRRRENFRACQKALSRSSTGTLSFNWRMVLLPCELQDYIVCHELAHVRFMDHSVSFWIFLNRLLPNAKSLDARLSKEGSEVFSVAR